MFQEKQETKYTFRTIFRRLAPMQKQLKLMKETMTMLSLSVLQELENYLSKQDIERGTPPFNWWIINAIIFPT